MATVDLASLKAVKIVDARGSACPAPLIEAKKAIGALAVGEVMEVWSCDLGTKRDIPLWAKNTGQEFLGVLSGDGYERIFVVRRK